MAASLASCFQLFLSILTTLFFACNVSAISVGFSHVQSTSSFTLRDFTLNNATGTLQAFDPNTQQVIPQGPATDGSGSGFDPTALIWIVFTLVIGVPMAVAGIRGWRLTTGVGIGLAVSVSSWAALSNSIGPSGITDLVLSLIVLGFFFLGFILGVFEFGRQMGMACLGASGGVALGIRIVLLRPGLIFGNKGIGFTLAWVMCGLLGLIGAVILMWSRYKRAGLLFACASVGTFLMFLGIDLVVNKQAGLSRGLRFFFDHNSSHIIDIISHGYAPPISSLITFGLSIALTPVLAYGQHRIFKQPFSRKVREYDIDIEEEPSASLEDIVQPKSSESSRLEKPRATFLVTFHE